MYCRNCGKELADKAEICINCGVKPCNGEKYCQNCGSEVNPKAELCLKCGVRLSRAANLSGIQYAGFWLRFVAFIIDIMILSIPMAIIYAIFSYPKWLISMLVSWLYFSLMESSEKQATLGKLAVGIKVTDLQGNQISFGRATGRHFAKMISGLTLFIGYIMAGFTEKKQALHDMIADCLVIKKS